MQTYDQMKARHQKAIDDLPLKFAFSDKQFKEAMESLGLKETDTDKIVGIGAGGFCTPDTAKELAEICKTNHDEMEKAFNDDDFLLGAFEYELANHEYIITYELDETLEALNISLKEYQSNERYQKIMKQAIENYKKDMERFGW